MLNILFPGLILVTMFSQPSRLEMEQIMPVAIEEAWAFFSQPKNLSLITPDYLDFTVDTPETDLSVMFPGQIISYTIKPVARIPIKWTTEITHVEPYKYFIDEQRFGPYKFWHHQHHFEQIEEGIKMTDIVHYLLPFGPIGTITRKLFVATQLQQIFNYRKEVTTKLFGSVSANK